MKKFAKLATLRKPLPVLMLGVLDPTLTPDLLVPPTTLDLTGTTIHPTILAATLEATVTLGNPNLLTETFELLLLTRT